jgi:teichuronic acid exporter
MTPQPAREDVGAAATTNRDWFSGMAWTAIGKWSAQLFSWVCTLIISRLVSPDDFGLLTMTTAFLGFVSLMAEAGIGMAVVNQPLLERSEIRQLNCVSIAFAGCGFLLVLSMSPMVAAFFERPELVRLLWLMGIPLTTAGLRAVPNALLQKALRFKLLSGIELAQGVTQALTTLVLAYIGLGYWALALGAVTGSVIATAILVAHAWPGVEWPRWSRLGGSAKFSSMVLLSNLAWYAYGNADFITAGKVLGATALGYYSLAWSLALAPGEKVGAILSKVAPGLLAKNAASVDGIRRDVCKLTKGIAIVVFPLAIGLALTSDVFVLGVLGRKWEPAIVPLRILCLYLAGFCIFSVLSQAAMAAGKPSYAMYSSVLKLVLLVPGFYYGSQWGPSGIALVWLLVGVPSTLPLYWMVFRHIKLGMRTYGNSLKTASAATAVMAIAVFAVRLLFHSLPPVWSLVLQVGTGGAVYVSGVLLLEPGWRAAIGERTAGRRGSAFAGRLR